MRTCLIQIKRQRAKNATPERGEDDDCPGGFAALRTTAHDAQAPKKGAALGGASS
jgi:hypothetical protein